jgi:RNA polymerase sigma factor (TIGR02999 family)
MSEPLASEDGAESSCIQPLLEPATEDELVRELLVRLGQGDREAREELFRLVAAELHALAKRQMRGQSPHHTLQATALVSEAYLKLFGREPTACRDKAHLMRAAARAMRQVLLDHARANTCRHRTPPGARVELDSSVGQIEDAARHSFLEFSEEVERLARISPDMARAMELRYILGFQIEEVARLLHMPLRTFERQFDAAERLLAARLR